MVGGEPGTLLGQPGLPAAGRGLGALGGGEAGKREGTRATLTGLSREQRYCRCAAPGCIVIQEKSLDKKSGEEGRRSVSTLGDKREVMLEEFIFLENCDVADRDLKASLQLQRGREVSTVRALCPLYSG